MKKILLFVLAIIIAIPLAACTSVTVTATPSPMVSSATSPTAVITSALPSALPTATPSFTAKEPSADTVVMAGPLGGSIYGGYSDGKWLTHSKAAEYCSHPMTFYEYNLAGLVGKVDSTGISSPDWGDSYVESRTADMAPKTFDENGFFTLNISKREYPDTSYSRDPLRYTYLYSTPPERLPQMEVLSHTSQIVPVVQSLLDEKFGKGKVKAKVRIAIKADIDGDGQNETIVNADNNADVFEHSGGDLDKQAMKKLWYCMSFIIENDGKVVMINDYYSLTQEDFDWFAFFYIQNIIDLDGDGQYEIVIDWSAWETYHTLVYKYDGTVLKGVLGYYSGS